MTGSDNWINERYFENRDMRPLFVEEIAIHPDYQGRGIGSFVIEQREIERHRLHRQLFAGCLFFGLLLTIFGPVSTQSLTLVGAALIIGAGFGMIFGIVTYAINRRRRDFTSTHQVIASNYQIIIDPELTATIEKTRARFQRLRPDPAFSDRLEGELMNAFALSQGGTAALPRVPAPPSNGRHAPSTRSRWMPVVSDAHANRRGLAVQLGMIALLLLTLIGGFVVFSSRTEHPAVLHQATPVSTPR